MRSREEDLKVQTGTQRPEYRYCRQHVDAQPEHHPHLSFSFLYLLKHNKKLNGKRARRDQGGETWMKRSDLISFSTSLTLNARTQMHTQTGLLTGTKLSMHICTQFTLKDMNTHKTCIETHIQSNHACRKTCSCSSGYLVDSSWGEHDSSQNQQAVPLQQQAAEGRLAAGQQHLSTGEASLKEQFRIWTERSW